MVSHHISVFFYLKINNDIMTLYCKWFDTHNEYEAYKNGQDYILPNVSICYQDLDVHYEKKYDPYNGHEYVDLGLPSGTLWAKCNVGAETETDYGLYFQWGDTQGYTADQVGTGDGKKPFYEDWSDYKYGQFEEVEPDYGMTKYNVTDGKTTIDPVDDAAHVNMGGEWRMPSITEYNELFNNTTRTPTTKNGVNGILATSNINGNELFFPDAGVASEGGAYPGFGDVNLWCSTKTAGPDSAWQIAGYIQFYEGLWDMTDLYKTDNWRLYGYSVRGVIG